MITKGTFTKLTEIQGFGKTLAYLKANNLHYRETELGIECFWFMGLKPNSNRPHWEVVAKRYEVTTTSKPTLFGSGETVKEALYNALAGIAPNYFFSSGVGEGSRLPIGPKGETVEQLFGANNDGAEIVKILNARGYRGQWNIQHYPYNPPVVPPVVIRK